MKKLVSLFTGGGGLDLGLEAAGFETLLAVDIDEHSCISLEANKENCAKSGKPFLSKAKVLRGDITTLTGKEVQKLTGLKKGEIDLLAGGPPCQAFSVFGKRKGREDPRGMLVYHYLRLITELRPKAFLFENVYGLLTAEKGKVFSDLKEKLSNPIDGLEYTLSIHRLNAADYGVPQFRDRVFIIGCIKGNSVPKIPPLCSESTDLVSQTLPWRTVANGLKGLPKIGHSKSNNHTGRVHSDRIVERYGAMRFGERDHFTRINRLDPTKPSYAIIVGSDKGGGKGHVHPTEPREVTPRESARMQCFPDWWWFSGTSRHPIRQVGNAVPTLLGLAIGRQILKDVFHETPNPIAKAIELLGQDHLFTKKEIEFLSVNDPLSR